jgi:putative transport protein
MNWLNHLGATQPVAHALLILCLVAVTGLALGGVRWRGVKLGTAGVLFAGIVFGHFGQEIEHRILEFVREFGLVLFVFTIGLQLGPGFFASFRRHGVRLNALATAVVLGGAGVTALGAWLHGYDFIAALGLFSGATTNTPSLGAAQQTLATLGNIPPAKSALPALAYAVSYPIGIVGIIGSLLIVRSLFRIDPAREAELFRAEQQRGIEPLGRLNLVVENKNLDGIAVGEIPGRRETGVAISRIRREGQKTVFTATDDAVLHVGDILLVVGPWRGLEQFARVVGSASEVDLLKSPGIIAHRKIVVTHKDVLGKTLAELGLDHLYGVAITRVSRADIEMTAVPDLRLQFGDVLNVVGDDEGLRNASAALGNSLKALNETQFVPIFVGIALGILAGSIPISFPGLPVPVKLGLAGGPLVLAILLGRLGHIGPLVWHMPASANLAFRELGITLFLACVGLKAGKEFFHTVFTPQGLWWMLGAIAISMIPLLIIACVGRVVMKLNYMTLSGMMAGSMTDPPALAFANAISKSDAPSVAYATVYPLTMLLRILAAQIMTLLFTR